MPHGGESHGTMSHQDGDTRVTQLRDPHDGDEALLLLARIIMQQIQVYNELSRASRAHMI
jgi:hypothetical protein